MYLSISAAQSPFRPRSLHVCASSPFFISNDLHGAIWFVCAWTHDIWINCDLFTLWLCMWSLVAHFTGGHLWWGQRSVENCSERFTLEDPAHSTEPQLSTCSLTVFANWVFSAKQDTMLSVFHCLAKTWKSVHWWQRGRANNSPMELGVFGHGIQQMGSESWVFTGRIY